MLEHGVTQELLKRAKMGDDLAKTTLIEENSPLIKSIVKRYRDKGVDYDDLFQLGCVGFVKAINNFDTSFNVKFSTYAVPMIAGEIKRFLRDDGTIKVSRATKSLTYKIQKYILERSEREESITIDELAKAFDTTSEDVVFALESSHRPVSLNDRLDKESSNSATIQDKIAGDYDEDLVLDKMMLKDIIQALPPKDKKIIILRYFRDKTQSEVASMLGVSQVQVSRLETKILERIKQKITDPI